jgi:DMSO/TMAO reductase YedYZ molybdopterin-dependent catalytic subunit
MLALTAGVLAACRASTTGGGPSGTGAEQPNRLADVEVRQYKGEKLGSINDFRENSIKGPQYVDRTKYRLRIDGLAASPKTFTYGQVLARPAVQKVVQLDCVEGWSVKVLWHGVLLGRLIDEAAPKPGANTVIFHAADGYTTSLPLDYIRARSIVLAYRMNDVEIPPERGFPFMVVAEDKWGYKWCKWVERIELSNDPLYRGFWESRGYSRAGDRNQPFFAQ